MMARIRTVKPEFWSSEQVMSCRPMARLLFIGLWNFCDDGGNHPLAPRTIKALVFPGDDITAEEVSNLLGELEGAELIQSYWVTGKNYFHVRGWKHQKIEKKNFKYPGPPSEFDDQSESIRQQFAEESSTDRRPVDPGREGKGIGEDQHNSLRAGEENSVDPKSPTEMTLDWVPDQKLLKSYALRMAMPVADFTSEATAAFVCHYSASGRVETQASWVSLLVKWVKRDNATASNVRQFPPRRQPAEPDFESNAWAEGLVVSP